MPKNGVLTGEKKGTGHKRHSVTDTQGRLLFVQVHAANIHDTKGGCRVFEQAVKVFPSLKGVCADAGYRKTFEDFVKGVLGKTVEIVERIKEILRSHPGKREVHLHVVDQQKTTTLKIDALVTSSPSLSADLKAILGPECLVRI